MIAKKNSGLDLERRKTALFQVGLLTAASFTLAAFTYTSKLPGSNDERVFSLVDKSMLLDFEQQPEPKVDQVRPPVPPSAPNPEPNPSDPSLAGNPSLLDVNPSDNQLGPIAPPIGPPNGGNGRTFIEIDEDFIEPYPPIPAEYIGGVPAMQAYIYEHMRYPEIDRETSIQGTVYVSFVVERNGTVSNVKVERGVSETIDREAIRVVKTLNQWIPAQNAFGKVRTNMFLPIKFTLE